MSHMSAEPAVPPPPLIRYADSRSADAPSPACSVDDGAVKATVLALRSIDIDLSLGGIQALSGTNLTVTSGEVHAIVGPDGAGRSSLVSIVSGLYRPDRESIWPNGRAMRKMPPASLVGLGVAHTFQNPALFRGLCVRDDTALSHVRYTCSMFVEQLIGLGRACREPADVRKRAKQVIHFVGLTEVQDQLTGTLPYRPQKRIELARTPVARPRLLLLDESLAGMTVTEKVQMAGLIHVARNQWGTTIVPIEHGIGLVLGPSDHVTVLDYGRKIANGTPQAARDDPAVTGAYLDMTHATADIAEIQ